MNITSFVKSDIGLFLSNLLFETIRVITIGIVISLASKFLSSVCPPSMDIKDISYPYGVLLSLVVSIIPLIFRSLGVITHYTSSRSKRIRNKINFLEDSEDLDNGRNKAIRGIKEDLSAIKRLHQRKYTSEYDHFKLLKKIDKKVITLEAENNSD